MIDQATFREDLFYRLNVIHLTVPPLRERREDIPILTNHFLRSFTNHTFVPREVSPEAMAMMVDYPWPGNVRELQNVIERVGVAGGTEAIRPEDLPAEIRQRGHSANAEEPWPTICTAN
jgi:DNA-binding NtrC family response regulator